MAPLNSALTRPLALLSAPVGFGKTTLVVEWLAQQRLPCAWITLDARDNHLGRFGLNLVAALSTLEVQFNQTLVAALHTSPPPAIDTLVARLVDLLTALPDEVVIVLDDYHTLTHPLLHSAVAMLIQHLPTHTHLVLLTRSDPPLPLAQWRARDQLVEFRAADLRFTSAEAAQFFQHTLQFDLPADALAVLMSRTEGWPAGLHLAALALRAQPGPAVTESFNGSHRFIVDYLAAQVLQQQPEPVQRFLLETAVAERLTAALCDELTRDWRIGSSQSLLDQLERANLFLAPLDDERRWFRYENLFAEFLRARLRAGQPERAVELHRRATAWHEQHGFIAEAVNHALAIGEAEQAARLIEQIAEIIWGRGEIGRLQHWLAALPEELIRARPRLCLFHAWILNITGDTAATAARLDDAERGLNTQRDRTDGATLRGMLATIRAIVAIMSGEAEAARAFSQQALSQLPEDLHAWRSLVARNLGNVQLLMGETAAAAQSFTEALRLSEAEGVYFSLVALYELAELRLVQGQLHAAADTCRRALALAEERGAGELVLAGTLHTTLVEVLREWDQLDDALRHAQRGVEIVTLTQSLGAQVCAFTRLSMVEQARGNAAGAARAFEQAARLAPPTRQHRTSFLAHSAIQAQLWARSGDWRAAETYAETNRTHADSEPTFLNEPVLLMLARSQLAQARPAEAVRVLARLRSGAEAAGRIRRVIEIDLVAARAYEQLGQRPEAFTALTHALSLAK
ncbi:MAG: hypothetical protein ACT4QE_12100, partial [Anaerolineales bacterium]